jgi:hypothetical protein
MLKTVSWDGKFLHLQMISHLSRIVYHPSDFWNIYVIQFLPKYPMSNFNRNWDDVKCWYGLVRLVNLYYLQKTISRNCVCISGSSFLDSFTKFKLLAALATSIKELSIW